jgi:D-lactate dehydrogenase (cytochrome)
MTAITQRWPEDLQVAVQPGLVYDNLNEQLKHDGLFFPPSPGGSGDIATIGGMVSTNASGIYSVKYGGTKEYILAVEMVTGEGEIIRLGNRAIKRSSGYNLVELLCGSEGTLGIITEITLKLAGLPEGRRKTAYQFPDDISAARAVSEMRRYGLDLAAIEFLDQQLMGALNQLKGFGLEEVPALFLEVHGPEEVLSSTLEMANDLCAECGGAPLTLEDGHNPWEIRHWATDAVKHFKKGYAILRNDVAFPISALPSMVEFCHTEGDRTGLTIFTFGHVGLGLLHALILARQDDANEWKTANELSNRIIKRALELGGTTSGEHGIGLGHKDMFELEHGRSIELMRRIKRQFDPHNILNPGKIFDL